MPRLLRLSFFLVAAALLLGTCVFITNPAGEPPGTQATPPSTQSLEETQVLPTPTQPLVVVPTFGPGTTPLPPLDLPEPTLKDYPAGEIFISAAGKGIVSLGAGGVEQLSTLPPESTYPFVSPSGQRVGFLYHQVQQDGTAHFYGVSDAGNVFLPPGNSPGRTLSTQPSLAAWSPDEQLVVSVNALGSEDFSTSYYVQVLALDTGDAPDPWKVMTTFQVKGLVDLTWSPDSRALAFIAAGEGGLRFYLALLGQASLGFGEQQPLQVLLPLEKALAVQALPGNRMLYATTEGIYLQAELPGTPHLVTRSLAPYTNVAFSASGGWAAIYTEEQAGLYILDLVTGNERLVSDVQAGDFGEVLTWSSDGRHLAFSLSDELLPDLADLYVTTLNGDVTFLRTIPRLKPGKQARNLVSWHPSEPYLTYLERTVSGYVVWLSAADGSGSAYLNPGAPGVEEHISWKAETPTIEVVELPLAPEPCIALEPRLKIGNSAFSSLEPPIVSLLYQDAGFGAPVIGSLIPGEPAWVLGGPICSKNSNFWLVRSKVSALVGWAAEGDSAGYYVTPRPDAILLTIKGKIYALPLDVPDLHLVADPETFAPGVGMQLISPHWLPDGESFSYLAAAPKVAAGLYIQPYPSGATVDLIYSLAQPGYDLPAGAWSPDGSRLVISLGPEGGNRDLFLIQANGSLVQNLTGSPGLDDRSPAWSPDGTRIVYLSGKGAETEMYVLAPGESISRLTNNQVEEVSPAWSPLGTRIAYAERTGSRPELFTMATNGTGRDRLTDDPGWYPAWSPDGLRIAFTDPVNDRLLLVDADGRNLRVLALAGDDQDPVQAVWAPSGDRLLFVYQNTMYIFDLTTNTSQPMVSGLDNPWVAWQP